MYRNYCTNSTLATPDYKLYLDGTGNNNKKPVLNNLRRLFEWINLVHFEIGNFFNIGLFSIAPNKVIDLPS